MSKNRTSRFMPVIVAVSIVTGRLELFTPTTFQETN